MNIHYIPKHHKHPLQQCVFVYYFMSQLYILATVYFFVVDSIIEKLIPLKLRAIFKFLQLQLVAK